MKTVKCDKCGKVVTALESVFVTGVPERWLKTHNGNANLCRECIASFEEIALEDLAKRDGALN